MQFYFASTDADADTSFECENRKFWFRGTVSADDLVLEDDTGRYLPISLDNLEDLEMAVFAAIRVRDARIAAQEAYDAGVADLEAEIQHFNLKY